MAHLLGSSFVNPLIQAEMTVYVVRGPNSEAILEKVGRWNPSPISVARRSPLSRLLSRYNSRQLEDSLAFWGKGPVISGNILLIGTA
ncbi:hypothetical protein PAAG_12363 [Paracoccidioides lutzii Pb01]|uniref:Uncharacterized protein n=1 Tax=Paracoccidioides lutzii (strain ATCC MYA-826 / Pb01) TaxID=502779 RepID=A0A0A2UZC5_PARBA|nr:hypothetical protein PAAG_12363 [Paracoccidioides lutzii Pb01]KGQ00936.1 hypothetical protein PAAG_12363 [Paracoccidioides lutzii Pb01]